MRFIITGEWSRNKLLKLIILLFFGYIFLFWLTTLLMYFAKMDLSYESVVSYYRGNDELFIPPKTFNGMLETTHFHLFAMGMLALTLTHLLLFVPLKYWLKVLLITLTFFSAAVSELSNWLVLYVSPLFAYLKISSFLLLEISMLCCIWISVKALINSEPNAYNSSKKLADEK